MTLNKITPIILAGGIGSRLWPLSRESLPKQLLPLVDKQTMLQNTYQRAQLGKNNTNNTVIITNDAYRFLVAEQMLEINAKTTIILEPCGRNTAPAVAVAALKAIQNDAEAILFILPADHVIPNTSELQQKILIATELAQQNHLVTFGICPTHPATEYGYIQHILDPSKTDWYPIAHFVEKPDRVTAETYLKQGNYLWNSGMFMFKASCYLDELMKHSPTIYAACQHAIEKGQTDLDFFRLDKAAFESCPSDSIDYLIMEKTKLGAVVPMNAGWNDIGSWNALCEASEKDSSGNVSLGDVIQLASENSYVRSESRLVAAVGMKDTIIVETDDVVLVASKNHVDQIKQLVNMLNKHSRSETHEHQRVYRPWGWYETLGESAGFKVKQIMVKMASSISLQMHHHRSEHWVVVSGTAQIICGESQFTLEQGQSAYIPSNTKHRLSNASNSPLHIIEVQCGDYLGEDDIVRFSDIYGRA